MALVITSHMSQIKIRTLTWAPYNATIQWLVVPPIPHSFSMLTVLPNTCPARSKNKTFPFKNKQITQGTDSYNNLMQMKKLCEKVSSLPRTSSLHRIGKMMKTAAGIRRPCEISWWFPRSKVSITGKWWVLVCKLVTVLASTPSPTSGSPINKLYNFAKITRRIIERTKSSSLLSQSRNMLRDLCLN